MDILSVRVLLYEAITIRGDGNTINRNNTLRIFHIYRNMSYFLSENRYIIYSIEAYFEKIILGVKKNYKNDGENTYCREMFLNITKSV